MDDTDEAELRRTAVTRGDATLLSSHAEGPRAAAGDKSFRSQTESRLGTLGSARRQPENKPQRPDVTAQTPRTLTVTETLLATHGIPFVASHHCRDLERAVAVATEIGAPVVLKADFAAPAHASDIDAVMLGVRGESAMRSCWRELERRVHAAGREWIGAIVQRLVPPGGADVLVGAIGDPDLGPVLAVGFGGRRAGLGRTAAFRLLPVTDAETDELIDSAEGVVTELDGFRGSAVLDREALRELMLRFALLLRELPEVVETDLNPVRCMTNGCVVLDMRLRIEHRRPVERVQTW